MNRTETDDLLTLFVAAVDNRIVSDETVLAWQSILADVDPADATEAVRVHFATSEAYLMPVHVRAGARDIRIARQRGQSLRAITAPKSVATDRAEEHKAAIRRILPQRDPDAALKVINITEWRWRRSQRHASGPAAQTAFAQLPPHLQEAASS